MTDETDLIARLEDLLDGVMEVTDRSRTFHEFTLSADTYHRIERLGEEAASALTRLAEERDEARKQLKGVSRDHAHAVSAVTSGQPETPDAA